MVDDLHYLLRRAEQEAIRAIAALHPAAAAAHRTMSRLYSSAALILLLAPAQPDPVCSHRAPPVPHRATGVTLTPVRQPSNHLNGYGG